MLTDAWWASLMAMATARRAEYSQAEPFPHVVMDGFFPEDFAVQLAEALDTSKRGVEWHQFRSLQENKKATRPGRAMRNQQPCVQEALSALNDNRMVAFLSELASVSGLVADPLYVGGGVHRIDHGGFLGIHADFNRHPNTRYFRRLNLLVYLNRDWKEDWGGDLELWDKPMQNCVVRVPPVLNRAVLFSTAPDSWHGHPEPVRCPEERSRLSMATYYYSEEPGPQVPQPHSTIFKHRPRKG